MHPRKLLVDQGPGPLETPAALDGAKQPAIRQRRSDGVSLGILAKEFGVSRAAIQRVEKRAG